MVPFLKCVARPSRFPRGQAAAGSRRGAPFLVTAPTPICPSSNSVVHNTTRLTPVELHGLAAQFFTLSAADYG